jgi:hypothetical protein
VGRLVPRRQYGRPVGGQPDSSRLHSWRVGPEQHIAQANMRQCKRLVRDFLVQFGMEFPDTSWQALCSAERQLRPLRCSEGLCGRL